MASLGRKGDRMSTTAQGYDNANDMYVATGLAQLRLSAVLKTLPFKTTIWNILFSFFQDHFPVQVCPCSIGTLSSCTQRHTFQDYDSP